MRTTLLASALLLGVLTAGGPMAWAQKPQPPSTDLAVTFSTERGQVTPSGGSDFWLKGGSLDASVNFFRGFGVATNVTGEFASSIAPGVSLSKINVLMGPRFTYRLTTKRETRVFVESLFGGTRGFGGVFPVSTGLSTHASSFAMQLGGGMDIALAHRFGLRVFEVDYVSSSLPNNGSNSQRDVRLAFGVSYHMGKR